MPHRPGHLGQRERKLQRRQFPFGGGGDNRFDFLNDIFFGQGNLPTFRGGNFGQNITRGLQPFGGDTRRGFQRRNLGEFQRLGFGNQAGASFNPFASTLGGIAPFSQSAEEQLRSRFAGMGIPRPMGNIGGALDITNRGRDIAKGSRGDQATGGDPFADPEDFASFRLFERAAGRGEPGGVEPGRRNIRRSRDAAGGDMFAGLDPLSQQLSTVGKEAQLAALQQFRAMANLGIRGPGGIQSILEQAEGPEQAILEGLPAREAELLGFNQQQAANQRRRQVRGLGGALGRTGVQRPGVAAAIAAGSAVPVNIAEQDRAFGLRQEFQNLEDRINLGQGQRRAGLIEQDMLSRAAGTAGLAGQAGQVAGILGQQFLDPTNPFQNQLAFQTDIMNQQQQDRLGLAGQQQIFQQRNMQYQGYLNRLFQTQGANIRLWMERQFKELGLGQYSESEWDKIMEGFKNGILAYGATQGGG